MLRLLPLLALLLAAPAFAQPGIAGDWGGYLDVSDVAPGQDSLLLVFHLVPDGDGYTATFDSPDQGAFALPTDSVAFDGETLTVGYAQAGIRYTGTVDAGAARIDGTWTQGPRSFPLVLTPYEAPAEAAAADRPKARPKARGDFSGAWHGTLALPTGGEVRMTFMLTRGDEGGYTAVLDAPGQAENLGLGAIEVHGHDVTIDIMGQASFTGTVSDDETTMEGTFAQGGQKLPMTLTRQ